MGPYCHHCNLRVAPFSEHVRFMGKVFHENTAQKCFSRWREGQPQKIFKAHPVERNNGVSKLPRP